MALDCKPVWAVESFGKITFGLKICVALDGIENSKEAGMIFARHADQIQDELLRDAISRDPEAMAEAAQERAQFLACFGDRIIFVEEIPYEYCHKYCCSHRRWYIVTTPLGRIKIGWRKRVINIDWSDAPSLKSVRGQDITPDDVTKWDTGIHAYGYDKAKEYISTLLKDVQ